MESEWGRGCCINSISWWQKGLEFCRGQPIKINLSTYFHLFVDKEPDFHVINNPVTYYQTDKIGVQKFYQTCYFSCSGLFKMAVNWFTQHWFLLQELIQVWNRNIILELFRPEIVMLWEYETTYIQINDLYNF